MYLQCVVAGPNSKNSWHGSCTLLHLAAKNQADVTRHLVWFSTHTLMFSLPIKSAVQHRAVEQSCSRVAILKEHSHHWIEQAVS